MTSSFRIDNNSYFRLPFRAFAIRNHKHNISRQSVQHEGSISAVPSNKAVKLEEIIEEQRIDWKRCEFVKSCIKRNISLNDNAEQNKKKLFI
ncbi:hypothetical protein F8M41_022465 [Gigaspora margarita]|uniref:Uncharacterized protein n=1 Tax=Gigaspora margarita TaxID=4874 RepID=A0A8H4AEY5_GIGMA|nr:hypothetical protein F8M41_022465 [Gigaspora margarita]